MCPQKWTYPTLHTSPSTHYSKLFNQCHGQLNNITRLINKSCIFPGKQMPAWIVFPDSVDPVHRSDNIWHPGLQGRFVRQSPESSLQVSGHVRGQPRWP